MAYFNLAGKRPPQFEAWGIAIRVFQVLLLGALRYLAARPPEAKCSRL